MATKLHFCPQCESMLQYVVNMKDTKLKCPNCHYEDALKGGQSLKTSIYGGTAAMSATITKAAIYDPSLRRSCVISCPNSECYCNKPEMLGQFNKEGRLIQPEVCVTNHTSINRVNTYICRICRAVFTQE
jgi:DNA-directed RNA polymerase subunit M/transcription elongation factor TFIIS